MKRYLLGVALGALLISPAGASTYIANNGLTGDSLLSGSADLTINDGSFTVTLTNSVPNERSSGQAISDFDFTLTGVNSVGAISLVSGTRINVNSDGTTSPYTGTAPLHWAASDTGGAITLTTLSGMMPYDLITGPLPLNNNMGFSNFNPYFLETATFSVDCPTCVAGMDVSGVQISFGTNGTEVTGVAAVPELSTWAMLLLGFVGVGLLGYRKREGIGIRFA
jgi:hypothetical protein